MTDYHIVVVRWWDAVSFRNAQLEDIDDKQGFGRVSIGILRRDTEDYILVQNEINPRNLSDLNYCIKIPRDLIISITKTNILSIREKKEEKSEED